MSFADRLWSVITLTIGLKTIPDLLDTNSTYTRVSHIPTSPHGEGGGVDICKLSWVGGRGSACRSRAGGLSGVRGGVPHGLVKWIDRNAFSEI